MAQRGCVWRKGGSWFLKYRENTVVDGKVIRKQKCVFLAKYATRTEALGILTIWSRKKWLAFGSRRSTRGPVNHSGTTWKAFICPTSSARWLRPPTKAIGTTGANTSSRESHISLCVTSRWRLYLACLMRLPARIL